MRSATLLAALAPAVLWAAAEPEPAQRRLQPSELSFSFQIFDPTQPVEHTYYLCNQGTDTVQVARIALTPPLQVKKINSKIPPNEVGQLVIALGTPRQLGEYQGAIEVTFKNKDLPPLPLEFSGRITPVIEVQPLPAFFLATTHGRTNSASLELLNKDSEPLQITDVQFPNADCQLKVLPLEAGRRYRLELVLRASAKPGRKRENITLLTSSKKQPRVLIQANTLVRERVYTFPERVDLGRIQLSQLKSNPALTNLINQKLMVYQEGGKHLEATASTDLDGLNLGTERSTLGDRCEIQVQIALGRLAPGPLDGVIRVKTNDRDCPSLEVPVQGMVE